MVKFFLGAKGSGKTMWLIDNANDDNKQGNGNIAFLDVDDDHIFSLDYNVRLINIRDYGVDSLQGFYGFLGGMLAMDYDLEKIYVDSLYKLIPLDKDQLVEFYNNLVKISEKSECKIFINLGYSLDEIPSELHENSIEVR